MYSPTLADLLEEIEMQRYQHSGKTSYFWHAGKYKVSLLEDERLINHGFSNNIFSLKKTSIPFFFFLSFSLSVYINNYLSDYYVLFILLLFKIFV